MSQMLKCRVGSRALLIPTEKIAYLQRASKWRTVPDILPPVVGAIQGRSGWLPVVDLSLVFDNRTTTPRVSTRLIVVESGDGLQYAALCEQVLEIVRVDSLQECSSSTMVELGSELYTVWIPSMVKIKDSHFIPVGEHQ